MIRNVRLVERDEQGQVTREVILGKEEFLVGRGGDCDLRLAEEAVSRHHCLIRVTGDSADVSDLGSSNGTFLNGQRIISQAPLHTGDVLRIGLSQFDVDLGDRPAHEPNPTRVDPAARTWRIKNLPGL
jgi:pSer/pThr/pTyr-binding forkhead associated (FHA) protein